MSMQVTSRNWRAAGAFGSYAPGSAFSVDLSTTVRLPFVPHWLCPHRCAAGIGVSAHHRERLDCFAGTGGPVTSC